MDLLSALKEVSNSNQSEASDALTVSMMNSPMECFLRMVLLFDMADHHGQKLTPTDVPFGRALSPGSRIVDMADRPASSERPDADTALLEACRKGDLRRVE